MHSFKKMCAIIDLFLSELFRPFLLMLYTIVKLPNIELMIAAGDVKEKKEDLKKIARESSRPGVDHRFMFAPLKVRSFNVSV